MLASFPKAPKTWRPKSLKSTFSIIPLSFNASSIGNPHEYPYRPYIAINFGTGCEIIQGHCIDFGRDVVVLEYHFKVLVLVLVLVTCILVLLLVLEGQVLVDM